MNLELEKNLVDIISTQIAYKYRIIPQKIEDNILYLFIDNSIIDNNTLGELEFLTGYEISLIEENPANIQKSLTKFYEKRAGSINAIPAIPKNINTADFLQNTINEAKQLSSSDIHIESYSEICRVRFRIDGKLVERFQIDKEQYPAFINKIKIKAGLDIAEKRLPQDGRILLTNQNNKIDIRVSVLPTLYGEKVVLRLLNNDTSNVDLEKIGLDQQQYSKFNITLKKPHGIILISGPTGSGKTTTLYATLKQLNTPNTNILTIEDPIEYTLDGVNQVQLKENIGLTFASALRTFLRQDPDIIMLGEIRDPETAQMAIRAALTGHLVLSTIHTNSAWGIVSRLIDMNVPSFLLANTLNMAIAQRLVRKLCSHCKHEVTDLHNRYPELNDITSLKSSFIAVGCDKCYSTGYAGRIAIYEVIPIDQELALCIRDNELNISDKISQKKITTLKSNAIKLVKEGITSVDETYPILLNY